MRDRLVWMDLEMTGLEPEIHTIVEIATIITDADLQVIAEGPSLVVYQPPEILANMSQWCVRTFGKTGLTQQIQNSKISLMEAERITLEFLQEHVEENQAPLCGNSIWQDRRFLARHMPELEGFLHYRIVDVSSIKELVRRWYPNDQAPIKAATHRALSDIRESIKELKFYRDKIFVDSVSR